VVGDSQGNYILTHPCPLFEIEGVMFS